MNRALLSLRSFVHLVATSQNRQLQHRAILTTALRVLACCLLLACASPLLQAQTAHFSSAQTPVLTVPGYTAGIAVDRNGNLYLVDNGSVLKESLVNGAYIQSVVPTTGLHYPSGLAVDGTGNIYIADNGNSRVVKETLSGGSYTQSIVVASGVPDPTAVAVDSNGNVYISDTGSGTVHKETLSGGNYTDSTIRQQLSHPEGIAVDSAGNVYVADYYASTVYKETPSGGSYIQSVVANDTSNGLSQPFGVAVDPSGNIYIADETIDHLLEETPVTGGYKQTTVGSGLKAGSPRVTIGVNGDIYVLIGGSVIAETAGRAEFGAFGVGTHSTGMTLTFTFDSAGTIGSPAVLTQGATGLDFSDNGTGSCNTNGTTHTYNVGDICTVDLTFTPTHPGTRYGGVNLLDKAGSGIATGYVYGTGVGPQIAFSATESTIGSLLYSPADVAVDGSGNVYIADSYNNRVLKEALSGASYTQSTIGSGLSYPRGVAVDGSGNVYIVDGYNNRVLKETPAGGSYTQSTIASDLNVPAGVAVDGSGNVYIADTYNHRVLKETLAGGTYAQSTIGSGLSYPRGVAVDGSGNVYIADSFHDRVLKEALAAGSYTQSTIGSGLAYPEGVAVDGSGNVYIADTDNSQVLKETFAGGSYTQSTIASGFNAPGGVAVDGSGNVYIADTFHDRVLKEDVTTPPSLSFATTNVGSTSSDSPRSVTLQNIGNADLSFPVPLTGDNPSLAASFTLDGSSTCPQVSSGASSAVTLTAGANCTLAVNFSPATGGSIKGSVVLTDNNLNAAAPNYVTQTIGLSGVGNQTTPTIAFTIGGIHTFGDAPFSVAATSNSSGAITYSLVSGPATVSSTGLLTISGAGSVVVQANQAASGEYLAGTAQATVTVQQAAQTITFKNPGAHVQGGTFTLAATGGASKNPVVFSSSTTSVCTVSGATVSLIAPGTCTITANQSGNANYLNATQVTQSFQVSAVFLLTATPSSQSFSAPGTAPVVLTLQPVNGFSGSVTLSCSGLPTGAVCPGLPHTYQLNGKATVTFSTGVLFPKGTNPGAYPIVYRAVSGKYNNATTVTINLK